MANFRLLSLDGNIASGKSTFLEYLREHYRTNADVIFLQEPVPIWETIKDKEGTTMITKFYRDQEKYAFSFQMMAYISRLAILRKVVRDNRDRPVVIISERSLFTDRHIFAKMLYDQGKIEEVNLRIYLNWFDEFADDFPIDYCIYIKASPEVCHQRVRQRARVGEDVIPLEYLAMCDRYHADYVASLPRVIELDGNRDIYTEGNLLAGWIKTIDGVLGL